MKDESFDLNLNGNATTICPPAKEGEPSYWDYVAFNPPEDVEPTNNQSPYKPNRDPIWIIVVIVVFVTAAALAYFSGR